MGLMTFLMLSCREATALTERQLTERLTVSDRVQRWMHLGACAACRAYAKQSAILDQLLAERDLSIDDLRSDGLEKHIIIQLDELRNAH